jgi:hypothetical protein
LFNWDSSAEHHNVSRAQGTCACLLIDCPNCDPNGDLHPKKLKISNKLLVLEHAAQLIDPSTPEKGEKVTMRVSVGAQYPQQLRKNATSHQVVSALLQVGAAQMFKPR